MRRPTTCLLASSLLLAACTAVVPPKPAVPTDPPRKAASPAPSAHASAKATAAPVGLLQKPAGAATRLAGRITLDAGYLVKAGAASLIGKDGATLIGMDGGSVIARDGASLIGMDGSTVIARDGASVAAPSGNAVIARDGASLIGDDGGGAALGTGNRVALDGSGVIARDGASVIARDGASVIARDGASVIARDGASYQLAQAAARIVPGTERPIAAMQLRVFSLTTGRPLTLGTDVAGNPVDAIYTNREGRFEVFLPADVGEQNVKIVAAARLPGDAAVRYELIAPPTREAELDEDTQLITNYMREVYTGRIRYLLERGPDKLEKGFGILPGANVPLAQARIAELQALLKDLSPEERERRYQAAGALLLSAPQTSIYDVQPLDEPGFYGEARLARLQALFAGQPSFEILRTILRRVRLAVAARVAQVAADHPDARYRQEPMGYFDELPPVAFYRGLRRASLLAPPAPEFRVGNPTDFNMFLVRAYLGNELTACAGAAATCDAYDLNGSTLAENRKYDGIARLLEGATPAPGIATPPANLAGLFVPNPSPDLPPRLSALYTGPDALKPDQALPQDLTWGLAYGARAISMRLLLTLLFTPKESLDPPTAALLDQFSALFAGR